MRSNWLKLASLSKKTWPLQEFSVLCVRSWLSKVIPLSICYSNFRKYTGKYGIATFSDDTRNSSYRLSTGANSTKV